MYKNLTVSNVQESNSLYGVPIAQAYPNNNIPYADAEVVDNDGYHYPYDL
jgi:hypothetical protein